MADTKARLLLTFKKLKNAITSRRVESNKDTGRSAEINDDEAHSIGWIVESIEDSYKRGVGDYEYTFSVVLIGDSGVGKSNLLSRFTRNMFNKNYRPTTEVEFSRIYLNFDGRVNRTAQIWDLPGQHKYRRIVNAYNRGAKGALIVYNVKKRSSFENVQRLLRELRENANPNIIVMLVGNMIDDINLREVSSEEGKSFAERESLYFIETSALESINVYEAFSQVISTIYLKTVGKKSITTFKHGERLVEKEFDTSSGREIERLEKVKRIFQRFDANDDGVLNRSELVTLIVTLNPRVKLTDEQIEANLDELFRVYSDDFFHGKKGLTYEGLVKAYDEGAGDVDRDFNVISTLPEISWSSFLIADRRIIDNHLPNKEELALNSPEEGDLLLFQTKWGDEISAAKDDNDQSAQVGSRNFAIEETTAFENHNDSSTPEPRENCGTSDDTISEVSDLINYNDDDNGLENRGTSPAVHGNDGVGSSTIFKMKQIKGELKHSSPNTTRLSNAKPNLRPVEDIAYYMYWEHITWTENSPIASPACLHQPTSCHFCKIFELGKVNSDENSYREPGRKTVSEKVQWEPYHIFHVPLDRRVTELERKVVGLKELDKLVKKHEKWMHITYKHRSLVISRRKLSSPTVNEVSDLENKNHNEKSLAMRGTSDAVYGFGVSDSGQIKMKDTNNKINYGHVTYNFQGQIRKYVQRKKRLLAKVPVQDSSEIEVPKLTIVGKYKRVKEKYFPWVTVGCLTLSFPLLLILLYRRRGSVAVLPLLVSQ